MLGDFLSGPVVGSCGASGSIWGYYKSGLTMPTEHPSTWSASSIMRMTQVLQWLVACGNLNVGEAAVGRQRPDHVKCMPGYAAGVISHNIFFYATSILFVPHSLSLSA